MAWVYILQCADGSHYVGSTKNLELRLEQHVTGRGAAYTRRRLPVQLVWCQEFNRIDEARALEKQVQNWSRAKRVALIEGRYDDLPALARRRGARSKTSPGDRRHDTVSSPPMTEAEVSSPGRGWPPR
ncbi:GIY-YIG nuclease family protein [Arachnia propionica]|uniref:GIY-YIG nuclease family protein n=1 Tax=Arachnia propionica TaxID=1750 RepID=A0A3P1WQX4_9ACTN|nr:GIY-YIG nuclease family protein [Arachnia propionica]RRD48238.1 GIY-YIG nuclease family protein [Arachnia propionica]